MNNRIKKLSLIGIVLTSILILWLLTVNNKKYIMYDGVMLAMSLTDSNGNTTDITEFPTGTNYTVEIDCGNTATGKWIPEEWKLAVEDIKENVVCNIDFYARTDNDKLSSIVQEKATTNVNGYRYSGGNPNNYVWFNNELWRIIGLVPVCTTASNGTCSARTNLIKIIRMEPIGNISYDATSNAGSAKGTWGGNTLYTLLNEYYYGKLDGTSTNYCYGYKDIAKINCDYSRIGISKSENDYYGKMIEKVYWNIGASSSAQIPGTVYGTEISKVTTNKAGIGLMSASDYGYAAIVSGYSTKLNAYSTADIAKTNWLAGQGNQWTNIQDKELGYTYFTLYVTDTGGKVQYTNSYYSYTVRPVLYLNAEVYKITGDGSLLNPYIIGM